MTHEEIIEGNRLIAEFLGSKFINDAPEDYPNGYYYQPEEIEGDCPTGIPEDWGFESSWDWLMPCIGKISNVCEEPEELDGLKYALLTNNIEEAWKFVVNYLTIS